MNIIQVPSPNHYDGRNGYGVDRITLHVMAGYRAGTASIFSNPNYQASSTYGVGGDGRIDQYVSEADGAWADGSYDSNCRTISIEHEGGLDFIPCTQACLDASAQLCADIARRYGWPKLIHGVNVFLHREIPPYAHPDCPDICPNGLNWAYIINKANQLLGNPGGEDTDMTSPGDIWNYNWAKGPLPGGNAYNALGIAATQAINAANGINALRGRTTHIIFQVGGQLGIANLLSGTYELFEDENTYKIRRYVLTRCDMQVREWKDVVGNGQKDNRINPADLSGFGAPVKQEK